MATPNFGFSFHNWTCSGGITITASQATRSTLWLTNVVDGTERCVANFNAPIPQVEIDFTPVPSIGGSVTASGAPAGSCDDVSCVFNVGSSVTLKAVPAAGFHFVTWSNCSSSTNPTLALNLILTNKTCNAGFVMNTPTSFTVNANVNLAGAGAVSPSSQTVLPGGTATITATTNPGFRFLIWNGSAGCGGTSPQLVISNIHSNTICTATYERAPVVTYATDASAGFGAAVFANVQPSGNSCSNGTCNVTAGGGVSLSATAGFLQRVVGWTCTETNTGSVQSSGNAPDPSALVLTNVQNNWTCLASMGPIPI